MTIKELIKAVGKSERELAFAEKNGLKKIDAVYISEKRNLIILCSRQTKKEYNDDTARN
jgi:hypothetical protein